MIKRVHIEPEKPSDTPQNIKVFKKNNTINKKKRKTKIKNFANTNTKFLHTPKKKQINKYTPRQHKSKKNINSSKNRKRIQDIQKKYTPKLKIKFFSEKYDKQKMNIKKQQNFLEKNKQVIQKYKKKTLNIPKKNRTPLRPNSIPQTLKKNISDTKKYEKVQPKKYEKVQPKKYEKVQPKKYEKVQPQILEKYKQLNVYIKDNKLSFDVSLFTRNNFKNILKKAGILKNSNVPNNILKDIIQYSEGINITNQL